LQQELAVLVDRVVVHASATVACRLVALIEIIVLRREAQAQYLDLQGLMLAPGTSLLSTDLEFLDHHPQRHTGSAAIAMGSVGEQAAAPKTAGDQIGISVGVDQVAGRGNLRT